jgi:hypothetical protein
MIAQLHNVYMTLGVLDELTTRFGNNDMQPTILRSLRRSIYYWQGVHPRFNGASRAQTGSRKIIIVANHESTWTCGLRATVQDRIGSTQRIKRIRKEECQQY